MSINRGMNKFSVASERGGIFQQLEKNKLWIGAMDEYQRILCIERSKAPNTAYTSISYMKSTTGKTNQ